MMGIRDKFKRIQILLTVFQTVLVALGAALSAAAKVDVARVSNPLIQQAVIFLQQSSWWQAPLCILAVPIVQFIKTYFGSPHVWDCVHFILDEFRKAAYPQEDQAAPAAHRVTLFQHRTCCWLFSACWLYRRWPWDGWLVPAERSGQLTRKSRIRFPATDDAKTAGVAGETWAKNYCIYIENLPNLKPGSTEATIQNFAKRTWCKPEWIKRQLKQEKSFARSFCGMPIEVRGKEWGVLLFDSTSTTMVGREQIKTLVQGKAAVLAKLLEKT
jgi:hypothetical protein